MNTARIEDHLTTHGGGEASDPGNSATVNDGSEGDCDGTRLTDHINAFDLDPHLITAEEPTATAAEDNAIVSNAEEEVEEDGEEEGDEEEQEHKEEDGEEFDEAAFLPASTLVRTDMFKSIKYEHLRLFLILLPFLVTPIMAIFSWARSGGGKDGVVQTAARSPHQSNDATSSPVVVQDLTSFVAHERANTFMDSVPIEEFPTDSFRRYAVATCSSAGSLEAARQNLALQLSIIPEEVGEKVLRLVLVEGISQKNSIQDATSELGSDGQAQSFMAFWSTTYNPKSKDNKLYETCFIVAGIAIKAADIVAGYREETKEVLVGSQPCNCGYITPCESCPILTTVTTKSPLFKRHSLSLKQQDDLHRWMTLHALRAAESMLATSHSSGHLLDSDNEVGFEQLGWKKPEMDFVATEKTNKNNSSESETV